MLGTDEAASTNGAPSRVALVENSSRAYQLMEVQKLIQKDAALVVDVVASQFFFYQQYIWNPEERPVVNLKSLNTFVQKAHFKMEGVHMVKELLMKDNWIVSTDLQGAYLRLYRPLKDVLTKFC